MMRKIKLIVSGLLVAGSVTTPVNGGVSYTDSFDGPALDPEWTVLGTAGTFSSGHYQVSHNGSGINGIRRTVGLGDFTEVLELDNMTFSGVVDTQIRHKDSSGYQLIVNIVNGTLACGVWDGSAYLPQSAVSLAGATDLNLRFTWTDEPGVGGRWLIKYEADDGGYQTLAAVPSSVYRSDDSSGRAFECWMAGAGTGTIDVDYYNFTTGTPASLLEAQVGYHPQDIKHAYLRSSLAVPNPDPTGQVFELVDHATSQTVSRSFPLDR